MPHLSKQWLKRITIALLIGITVFGVFNIQQAHAAIKAPYDFAGLFNTLAYCGSPADSGVDGGLRYGFFCYFSVALQLIVVGVLYGIGNVFALLLFGLTFAAKWMITFGIDIMQKIDAIPVGFAITLKIANLIFVIAIIVIAFATILRWHEYEAKKMLPKLIIAALLVNFSFLITGLMLDVSNVFTNYFLVKFEPEAVGTALQPQFVMGAKYRLGGGYHSWEDFMVIFPQVIFAIVITFVMMLAMLAVFVMALIRNIWVILLLILMPLAWSVWVVPRYNEYWKKWWNNFLNWGVIYLPILTFFLFIALQTASIHVGSDAKVIPAGMVAEDGFSAFINDALQQSVKSFIVIGLIIGGLKVAQSMGSGVAGAFAGMASRGGRKLAGGLLKTSGKIAGTGFGLAGGAFGGALAGTWQRLKYRYGREGVLKRQQIAKAKNAGLTRAATRLEREYQAGKPTIRGVTKAGAFGAARELSGRGNLYGKLTEGAGRLAAKLSWVPGMTAAAKFLAKTSASQRQKVEDAKKEADGMSPAMIDAWITAASLKDQAHQMAAAIVASDKHRDIPRELLGKFANAIAAYNPGAERDKMDLLKELMAHDPRHAADVMGSQTDEHGVSWQRRATREASDQQIQSWSSEVYSAIKGDLTNPQKLARARTDGDAQTEMIVEAITGLKGQFDKIEKAGHKDAADAFRRVAAGAGIHDDDLMKEALGYLQKIAHDKSLETLRKGFSGIETELLKFGQDAGHVVRGSKTKTEHGAHTSEDFRLKTLFGNLMKAVGASSGKGNSGSLKATSSGGGGHGGPKH